MPSEKLMKLDPGSALKLNVLVPTFNDANDRVALNTLAELFPDREVVGIYCRDLVLGLGTIHCMTQQLPSSA